MEPLISVIIPVFNMELYLARCLDSVLNNTYRNLEVMCVDDGSKDRSLEILREYEKRDSRIVVIAKENGGVSSARNAGLDRMTGEYVSFIDPDDFIHPQYFELLLRACRESGAEVACCGFRVVEEKDLPMQSEGISFEPSSIRLLSVEQFFKTHNLRSFCWGKLISAPLTAEVRFRTELHYSEDSVFVAELWERCRTSSAAAFPAELYYYYQREGSLIREARLADRLKVAGLYMEKALACTENEIIFLDQAVKRCLSVFYLAAYILPDRSVAKECRSRLKAGRGTIRRTKVFRSSEKMRLLAFIRIPRLYWLYRSIKEPDMRRWELVERKKRREAKQGLSLSL